MNKKIYIELLEEKYEKHIAEIWDLKHQISELKIKCDPIKKAARDMERKLVEELYNIPMSGLDSCIKPAEPEVIENES